MTLASPRERSRRFGLAHLIAFLAGIVFFALSFLLLAILPGQRLEEAMVRDAPVDMVGYTPLEARGRAIYAREGCDYCHTEQVRGTLADVARWGPATQPWETRYDYPQVWGTRRIGPDLAREAGVRSHDWQLTHLFNPRWVVPGSVMPGYPWLFDGDTTNPDEDGRAVLAYLDTLGRAMRSAGPSAICPRPKNSPLLRKASAPGGGDAASVPVHLEDDMVVGGSLEANAATRRLSASFPDLAGGDPQRDRPARRAAGATVFAQYCSGCHGGAGSGNGPAAASLLPHPANLHLATYSDAALAEVLWNGRPGTSMPAWRDLSKIELADVIAFIGGLHAPEPPMPTTTDALARGATVYAQNCIACHGVDGHGNGPAAHVFLPRPANFTRIRPKRARVLQALAEGVPGASMPIFAGLSPQDRLAVSDYVRSLYEGPQPKGR